jgi:hypothetical protein
MPDYIPAKDDAFNTWQLNLFNYLNSHLTSFGLVAADTAALGPLQGIWTAAMAGNIAAQDAAHSASSAKDAARQSYEAALRALVARIQANATVTDANKLAAGLTARDKTRTPASVPTTPPVAVVDTSRRLAHIINFRDATAAKSTGKPKGVMGCEIWVKVGDPAPADPSECRLLAMETATPHLEQYDGTDGSKKAYYLLRWVNTRGEQGPWSETVSATIPA